MVKILEGVGQHCSAALDQVPLEPVLLGSACAAAFCADAAMAITAQRSGFAAVLLTVCLDDCKRLLQRVTQRVQGGGHAIPVHRVLARYFRTLENMAQAVRMADMVLLLDTGGASKNSVNPPVQIAICRGVNTRLLSKKTAFAGHAGAA